MLTCKISRFLGVSVLAALLATVSFADVNGPGWGTDASVPLSINTAFAVTDTLTNGNRVVYDGSQVWIETDAGVVVQSLGNPGPPSFIGFIEVDPTETFAVLGESSNGQIWRVSLTTGGPTPLAVLPFNYDIAFESTTSALVSAANCIGFVCTNSIYRMNLVTGATTQLVLVDGYSGPVSISSAGDVYLGVLPNGLPGGGSSLLRWTAAQIANGPFPLTEADATVFTAGLDGVAEMEFDPAFGHLIASATVAGVQSVLEIDRGGAIVGSATTSTDVVGKVEVFDAPGNGACAAFQPAGRVVKYRTTDYVASTSKVTTISPRRPVLTAVQNGNGTMTCTLTGGQPNSPCMVISGNMSVYSPVESSHDLSSYLFWTGIPFDQIRRAGLNFVTDSSGTGSFTFNNPVSIQGTRVLQVLVRDAHGVFRGSSTPAFN
jgi:hypothetical protein